MYADDANGQLPCVDNNPAVTYNQLPFLIGDYLKLKLGGSGKVLLCPSVQTAKVPVYSKTYPDNYLGSGIFYRPNQENGYYQGGPGLYWNRSRKLTKLQLPSCYTTVAEVNQNAGGQFYFNWINDGTNKTLGLRNHTGGSVYLHGDGHADLMKIAETARGISFYNKYFFPNGKSFDDPGVIE